VTETAYFQAIANYRRRRKNDKCLQGPNGLFYDQKGMMQIAVDFYKMLFAKENNTFVKLDENF
jgi:hypothetical protein